MNDRNAIGPLNHGSPVPARPGGGAPAPNVRLSVPLPSRTKAASDGFADPPDAAGAERHGPAQRRVENRRVLVVDDTESIHADFRKILGAGPDDKLLADAEVAVFGEANVTGERIAYNVDTAFQGLEAVDMVKAAKERGEPYAMAFVDMRMPPGIDGLDTVQRMWAHDPEIQIVIATAYSDYSWPEMQARLGQTDRLLLLRKPFDNAEVAQLACGLTSKWALAKQASLRMTELERMVEQRTLELRSEISERRAAEAKLLHAASHDMLTGLVNRSYLIEQLDKSIERKSREPDFKYAVLFLDCDNFKSINDTLGHEVGDDLLRALAARLTSTLRRLDAAVRVDQDTTARFGGDEIIVLLNGLAKESDAQVVAERVLERMKEPFSLRGSNVSVSTSIGIAIGSDRHDSPDDVIRDADTAMYRAKGSGKAGLAIFDERLHQIETERLRLENELRHAVDNDEFALLYEPIINLQTASITGFEALVRWRHPERGLLSPAEFIPIAEETGLIVPMGQWVAREAVGQLARWRRAHARADDLFVSINLSKKQLADPSLIDSVRDALSQSGLPGSSLVLEITEDAVASGIDSVVRVLDQLKSTGLSIHLDDFGTGLSSLSLLHRLPIDALKIDRSFVSLFGSNREYAAVVYAVLTLAKHLGRQVIAEGVENKDQVEQLIELGCDFIQGYHISRPMPSAEAARLLEGKLPWSKAA